MALPVEELTARVRAGESVDALAAEYGVRTLVLHASFYRAGYTSTGHPREEEDRVTEMWMVRTWFEPWMEEARCKYTDPDCWFPGQGPGNDAQFAKQVCKNDCPVRLECLEYAMRMETGASTWSRQGIWGGMTAQERRKYEPEWLAGRSEVA